MSQRAPLDPHVDWTAYWHLYVPKLVTVLREGYSLAKLRDDAFAGLSVAIVALPLSMAIAIASGATPDKGLITSIVGGAFISAIGGSRYQIGGPAAAFVVIVVAVIQKQGYDGLVLATFLAGLLLIIAGFLKLGTYIKYVPGPVVLGFTSGIGATIFLSQVKDFLGLSGDVPAEFVAKLEALWAALPSVRLSSFLIASGTLAAIVVLRRFFPRLPGLLIAVGGASILVWLLRLDVATVGGRYGGIPNMLPIPCVPDLTWHHIVAVLPSAFTIAFLIAIESLLSAMAADAMTGGRTRSNMEMVGQGAANMASALFGGLPATGVIARTGTNITAGSHGPVSGLFHAGFILAFVMLLAPLASYLAMPCLAAVLVHVSWRLLDIDEISRFLSRAPWDDRLVLITTLLLTVLVDLSVAIGVGVVMASMLFIHRMAEIPGVQMGSGPLINEDVDDLTSPVRHIPETDIPDGVKVIQLRGPIFFGAAQSLRHLAFNLAPKPKVLIVRLREVPLIDATGVSALEELFGDLRREGTRIIITGMQNQPRETLLRSGVLRRNKAILVSDISAGLAKARELLGQRTVVRAEEERT